MSLEEDIYAVADLPRVSVDTPEWDAALKGQRLYVQMLPGSERDALEAESFVIEQAAGGDPAAKLANFRARVLVRCVVAEDGTRVFSDAAKLGRKSSVVLDRLYDAAASLNRLRKSDQEELAKNSESAPNGASGSNSATATTGPSPNSSASSIAPTSPSC